MTLMDNPDSRALILSLMEEVVSAAEACGHRSMPEGYPQRLLRSTDPHTGLSAQHGSHDFRHGRGWSCRPSMRHRCVPPRRQVARSRGSGCCCKPCISSIGAIAGRMANEQGIGWETGAGNLFKGTVRS